MECKESNNSIMVRDFMRDPKNLLSLGINKYIIRKKFDFIEFKDKDVIIKEKLFPLILKTHITCNFAFINVPKNINSINMVLQDKILETGMNHNGIIRFRTFAYSVSEDPLISICFEKNKCIKFTYVNYVSVDLSAKDVDCVFLFDSLSLSKKLHDKIINNTLISNAFNGSSINSIIYKNGKGKILS